MEAPTPSPAASHDRPARLPLSAVVVSYNRAAILGTTLRALAFADELIVVDKSSTDGSDRIAAGLADRVVSVPWSPTVEDTRVFAVAQCRHEWVLLLDDDECFSAAAIEWIDAELRAPRALLYRFPLRHYVLGVHDERAYYWPEGHVRLFRRDVVALGSAVHAGIGGQGAEPFDVPGDGGVCIHHLSHADAAQWIEKTNRYTSRPHRLGAPEDGGGLMAFAQEKLAMWASQAKAPGDPYIEAVLVLRAVYDMVDRVKKWEEQRGRTGEELFADACAGLEAEYRTRLAHLARPRYPGSR